MDKKPKRSLGPIFVYLILFAIIVFSISRLNAPSNKEIGYTELLKQIDKGQIIRLEIEDSGLVRAKTKTGDILQAYAPTLLQDEAYTRALVNEGIQIKYIRSTGSSWWVSLLIYMAPILIMILFWVWLFKGVGSRGGGGAPGMNFKKSPARKFDPKKAKIGFKDVAGIDEAREELEDIVTFLKNPQEFNTLGARMPKGVLLVGQPGTGKTLIARAVAGEAGVPFFYISGSDFVELFVGVGASRVREMFNQAKAEAPAIIFIDEIDAVGRQRGAGLGGGHDEREQTLNSLLVEMDGFDPKAGIIVMAATNRPDILDKALLRPGRFDKKVVIDAPDLKGREEILKVHMKGKKISKDVDPEVLARGTPGFVGADLENLINESALLAARNKREFITMEDCSEAIERVIAGPERRSRKLSDKEKKIVTYHELGHAMLGYLLPNSDPVHKITIVPRGHAALGYTLQLPLEEKFLMSEEELKDRIITLLGGRASEDIIFNEITSGAGNDLKRATEIVKKMVTQLGMSKKIGPIAWGEEEGEVFLGRELTKMKNYSQDTAKEIDNEIKNLIIESYERAKNILGENKQRLDLLAAYLYGKETIDGEEFKKLMEMDIDDLNKKIIDDENIKIKILDVKA
ncbi:ATP-dependent zinc metalloprotease FtsH [Oceanotoga sp. DSM 15011]|jgi:cell division protease FtsH|uniref:ATP-dependent zinc metalloprotease FtsH n=1 Tax=Oceanotoga TaxID=1255275 RepID=UPI0021F3E916|nr:MULTISPECIES: ATP-dependent zinc metalloprotease FtsH [Oceanotoga]MDN5341342.1 cell division protease FtsH [Oceanotoga sp.]MDO7976932.1 ATP-dependent zinc metalloprotease FtsH [Oceanotoga teriensis]UYO99597.1 ATP-dependent zinc metalloprotease FtsH [Oceanotoga sp. DSM 15011]